MAALSDIEIREMIESGKLKIANFSESCLGPASYDLRLGSSVYRSSMKEPKKLTEGDVLTIEPNEFVLVTTYEILELPCNIISQVGLRARFSLSGLLNISGLQVDPGFKGRLVLGMTNLSQKPRTITYLDRIFTIQFQRLSSTSSKSYDGDFVNLNTIPSELLEKLRGDGMPTQHELIGKLESLETRVRILFSALGILVTVLLAFLIFILDKLVH
jgi:dCTP deaminase